MKNIFTIFAILFSFVLEAQQTGEFVDKRDGKKYKTTLIGGQVWMAENLNVSKFRNGDPIPEAKSPEEWTAAARDRKAAWCYFENDPKNGDKFGKLYNFFAVSDPRGLAPEGWHVPTNDEFSELINGCGTMADAFVKLKSGEDWGDKKGTNSLGFKALPGGMRFDADHHHFIYQYGLFWTATEQDPNTGFHRYYGWPDNEISLQAAPKQHGFSVRCVKAYRYSETLLQDKKLSKKDRINLLSAAGDSLYNTILIERALTNKKVNEYNNQIAVLDEKVRNLIDKSISKSEKIKESKAKLTDLTLENTNLQSKVDELSLDLKGTQDKLNEVNNQLLSKNQQINSLETQLKTAQDNSSKLVDQANLNQEIANLRKQLQEKTDSIKSLRSTLNKPTNTPTQNNSVTTAQTTNSTNQTGNVSQTGAFKSVKIGSQTWMTENLNVSTFRNGDPIPEVKTQEEWERAGENKQPAWCYYNNDPANGAKYGKLYNWYAVNDPRGLAPFGWHVPNDAEWMELISLYGGIHEAGIHLKSTTNWISYGCQRCYRSNEDFKRICQSCGGTGFSNTESFSGNGNNSSGFNGLPGGQIRSYGFDVLGQKGFWWSVSENEKYGACPFSIEYHNKTAMLLGGCGKGKGSSVRCIKD